MKLVIVLLTHIDNLPPARNLLLSLAKNDIKIKLITMYSHALPEQIKNSKNFEIIDVQSETAKNRMQALGNRIKRRKLVRTIIKNSTNKEDIVWTVTDYDAMEVGKILLNHRHVMQLMELIHDIPIFDEFPFIKAHIDRYGKNAEIVIVPEYNRAHIQKAYWKLKEIPKVLPNRPNVEVQEFDVANISHIAHDVISKIGSRKIVLYQGVFGYERVLDQFIEAVDLLGEEYCMLLMGRDDEELQKLLKKYPQVFFIPFIPAPNHLAVTCRAHIGVLSYVNNDNIRHYDPLNAVYCAPNKIYEYACFGVPMIGNDIPGLDLPFRMHNIGKCAKLTAKEIAKAIKEIENNYESMSKNCKKFYTSIDMDKLVSDIVDELKSHV